MNQLIPTENKDNSQNVDISAHGWSIALISWPNLIRFLILIIAFLVLLFAGLSYILPKLIHGNIKINATKNGLEIDYAEGKFYQVLISSNITWQKTGVVLKKGDIVTITASGRTNLALDRLMEYNQKQLPPKYGWGGPVGLKQLPNKDLKIDSITNQMLMLPNTNFGALLIAFKKSDNDTINQKIKPDLTFSIDDHVTNSRTFIIDNTDAGCNIFLCINDLILEKFDAAEKLYYMNSDSAKLDPIKYSERWEDIIKKNNYKTIWYDDNIGNLLVTIKVTHSAFD